MLRPNDVGSTLDIGANILVHGTQSGFVGTAALGLANHGTIKADTSGRVITVNGTNWTNDGKLWANTGTLATAGSWSSSGASDVIQVDSTGTLNLGGTFASSSVTGNVVRTAGTVNLTSTLDLAGAYDLGAAGNTGSLQLQNGSQIQSGTLSTSAGTNATLVSGVATLSGVTLAGDVVVNNNTFLNIASGGLVLANGKVTIASQGNVSEIVFLGTGSQFLSGTGEIVFGGTNTNGVLRPNDVGSTLDIGANILVHSGPGGQNGTIGSVTLGLANHGVINADASGKVITITGTNWTNDGQLLANGGSFAFGGRNS